jgi:predicted O-methyltransferase YrrM
VGISRATSLMAYLPGPNYALDDFNLRGRLREIITEYKIDAVVETGLNDGQSTLAFCQMAPFVIGVDHDPQCIEVTRQRIRTAGLSNFRLELGHSPDVLKRIMGTLPVNALFFIDAHWDGECPTLDEIRAIPAGIGILVFHDFQVPGHENDFGWDHMIVNGVYHEMNENFLREDLLRWSPTYRIEYAKAVSGSKRGFCFVYPK